MSTQPNEKLCECGCGQATKIATRNYAAKGHVKGRPLRYVAGHHGERRWLPPPNPSGLCMCGCGERAPVVTGTNLSQGYIKGQAFRYILGHCNRVQSDEQRAKNSAANRGRKKTPEHRRAISLGEGGTGDPSYKAIHQQLARDHPKSGVCEDCGKVGPTDYAFQHHPRPHTRERSDYRELCKSCHNRFDAAERRARKGWKR